MGAGFWIRRFFSVYGFAFLALLASERFKGHGWERACAFSALWGGLSASLFIGTRLYHASKGARCAICRDMPE